jgi:hypothetical protein
MQFAPEFSDFIKTDPTDESPKEYPESWVIRLPLVTSGGAKQQTSQSKVIHILFTELLTIYEPMAWTSPSSER